MVQEPGSSPLPSNTAQFLSCSCPRRTKDPESLHRWRAQQEPQEMALGEGSPFCPGGKRPKMHRSPTFGGPRSLLPTGQGACLGCCRKQRLEDCRLPPGTSPPSKAAPGGNNGGVSRQGSSLGERSSSPLQAERLGDREEALAQRASATCSGEIKIK